MKPYKLPTPEHLLTNAIRGILNAAGIWHFKHWGGPMGTTGVPDIIGCHKGRFIAIEVKAGKNAVSPAQKAFLEAITRAGGIGIVARSIDDVIDALGLQDRFLLRGRG